MSDDEEIAYVKRQKIIHFGSLEEQERLKLAEKEKEKDEESDDNKEPSDDEEATAAKETLSAGDVNISEEYMELEEEENKEKQMLLEEFERRKKARQINVSTDDAEVKATLRQIGEPILSPNWLTPTSPAFPRCFFVPASASAPCKKEAASSPVLIISSPQRKQSRLYTALGLYTLNVWEVLPW